MPLSLPVRKRSSVVLCRRFGRLGVVRLFGRSPVAGVSRPAEFRWPDGVRRTDDAAEFRGDVFVPDGTALVSVALPKRGCRKIVGRPLVLSIFVAVSGADGRGCDLSCNMVLWSCRSKKPRGRRRIRRRSLSGESVNEPFCLSVRRGPFPLRPAVFFVSLSFPVRNFPGSRFLF